MPNIINRMLARELTDALSGANGMLFVSYDGLTMPENEELRDQLAEQGVQLRVVKNRIARQVLSARGLEVPVDMFKGNVAVIAGDTEDAINAAKVISKSPMKKEGKVAFRGGLLEGDLQDSAGAAHMATLENLEELRGKIVGCIAGPLRGIVGVLNAPGSALVRVNQARVDEGGGA